MAASDTIRRATVKSYEGDTLGINVTALLRPLHKAIDHLLLASLVEGDGELVAIDFHHMAVAEFLVEDAVVEGKFRHRAGGFRHQLALNRQRRSLLARKGRKLVARRIGGLVLIESAPGLPLAASVAATRDRKS